MSLRSSWESTKDRFAVLRALLKRYQQVLQLAWAARHEIAGPERLAAEKAHWPRSRVSADEATILPPCPSSAVSRPRRRRASSAASVARSSCCARTDSATSVG